MGEHVSRDRHQIVIDVLSHWATQPADHLAHPLNVQAAKTCAEVAVTELLSGRTAQATEYAHAYKSLMDIHYQKVTQ